MKSCMACQQQFTPNVDKFICDDCLDESYKHKPKLYARITLVGFGSYVQPLDKLGDALDGEIDGANAGAKWIIELIEMSGAEYNALPEFAGH